MAFDCMKQSILPLLDESADQIFELQVRHNSFYYYKDLEEIFYDLTETLILFTNKYDDQGQLWIDKLKRLMIDTLNERALQNLLQKILSIFEKANNLDLLRKLLEITHELKPKQLANLIFKYKWDVLKTDLHDLLEPQIKTIKSNCDVVKVIFVFI